MEIATPANKRGQESFKRPTTILIENFQFLVFSLLRLYASKNPAALNANSAVYATAK